MLGVVGYRSDFRRKRNIYARCGFFVQSFFADRNYSFQQKLLVAY